MVSRHSLTEGDNTPGFYCERCAAIDFDKIFRIRLTRAAGLRLLKLGKITDLADHPSCPICRFFAEITQNPSNSAVSRRETEYNLNAFSAVRAFLVGFSPIQRTLSGLSSGVCLAVLPDDASVPQNQTQYIGVHQSPTHDTLRFRSLDPAAVDFQIIRHWYQFCATHHALLCSLRHADSIPDLRVIDCLSQKIVSGLWLRYAALSYVWSDSREIEDGVTSNKSLPSNIPAVIEDAITLSIKLGLRYLWVDRYCIPQDNLQQRLKQIKHMDLVYKSAEITIIAAAGCDPLYGLPGVGSRPRIPQPAVKVQDKLLVSSLPNPMEEIKTSKWMKRAWTYQEGILSRRRVIFTPRQVYFECRTMHCCEAIDVPLDVVHHKSKQQCKADILPGIFPQKILGDYPWSILTRINEYLRRELRYESDRLYAILGIFHALHESRMAPSYHYLGVPLMTWPHVCDSQVGSSVGFLAGLQWDNEQPAERRDGFPSWSWTGWYGLLKESENYHQLGTHGFTDIKVWIELPDSKLMEWPTGDDLARMGSTDVSRFLQIQAWTFQMRFEYFEEHSRDGTVPDFRVLLPERMRIPAGYSLRLSLTKVVVKDGELHHRLQNGIFLGITLYVGWTGTFCTVLVVESFGDHVERLGIVEMGFSERIFDTDTGQVLRASGDLGLSAARMVHRLG